MLALFHIVEEVTWSPFGVQTRQNLDSSDLTPDAAATLERARASLACGGGIPDDEILREFGLTQ
jgi:hypothetical protein